MNLGVGWVEERNPTPIFIGNAMKLLAVLSQNTVYQTII